MTTSTPLLALSAGLRAPRSLWHGLRTRTHRTRTHTHTHRTAAAGRSSPAGKDFSLLPVCGQFPATAPVRITERHR